MAKKSTWNFEDYVEAARVAVTVVSVGIFLYEEAEKIAKAKEDKAANKWVREASARMDAMVNHALAHNISREAFEDTISMARNLIAFEAVDTLGNNRYMGEAVNSVNRHLDRLVANVI